MSVPFLSEDYVNAANAALAEHAGFVSAIEGVSLAMQWHITDMPDGDDVAYYVDIGEGEAEVGLGELADADVTVTNNYETAVGISKGELNTQMAFMTGKLKVSGDMSKLLLNQATIAEFANALGTIDATY